MILTFTNVQRCEAIPIQQPIDNQNGSLRIGLRSITLTVGWYNIEKVEKILVKANDNEPPTSRMIEPGLYSFKQLKDAMEGWEKSHTPPKLPAKNDRKDRKGLDSIDLTVSSTTGLISMTTLCPYRLSDRLLEMLGLDDGLDGQWLQPGTYTGDRPVNFFETKVLCVHLEEINTTDNLVDGTRSTLLASVGVGCPSFGDVQTIYINNPEYKRLSCGTLSKMKISIKDVFGKSIDNHQLPIYLTLEVL